LAFNSCATILAMKGLGHKTAPILAAIVLLLAIALGFFVFQYFSLKNELARVQEESTQKILSLQNNLEMVTSEKDSLHVALNAEQERVDDIAGQFKEVSDTVGDLKKLSETDKELLQKYSKVYFLNEHYVPQKLTQIDDNYVYRENESEAIHTNVWPYLESMLEEAEDDNIPIKIISAYRSFGEQAALKSGYTFTYGSGANKFSADQGYSEHQLGTALDFTTPALGLAFTNFETTEAYKWLTENAYRYGFILSYPKGNAYYLFEPWHWRFIGRDLARKLHRENINFYDEEQRVIDQYLISIFD
jgi:zinc D-Ala-D-Ala carboxypeptidase